MDGTGRRPEPRSPLRLVLGIALTLAGTGWLLQGLGILTAFESFMVGDPTWVVIGAGTLAIGLGLTVRALRRPA